MIEEIITQFKGKTFSSHDEVVAWLKEKLTAFEKKTKEDLEKKVIDCIEDYFRGLLVVPFPGLTKNSLLEKIKEMLIKKE